MTGGKKVDAIKHRRSGVSTSIRQNIPGLDDIRKAPNGKATVEALISAGVDAEKLESAMQFVVFVCLMPPAARLQDVRGFSRKSLPLFPAELRRTATRLELVRKNPFYAEFLNLAVPSSNWEQTCAELRMYAHRLEIVIRSIRQNAEANSKEYDLRLFAKRMLLATIAEATGRPPFEQVAQLLSAAYDLAVPDDPPRAVEASTLRHLWTQYEDKNRKRRYRKWPMMMNM